MTTNHTDEILTAGDMVDSHRAAALELAEKAEHLGLEIAGTAVSGERYRRLNQQLGVALKLATVHAHLAQAIAVSARPAPALCVACSDHVHPTVEVFTLAGESV